MDTLQAWFANPDVGKVAAALIGLLVVYALWRVARRAVNTRIDDPISRYQLRKAVTYFAYLAVIVLLAVVFRTRLSNLALFLGFVGAAVVFSLQEVITSVAGWLSITVGRIYHVGDRIEIGGIKGDVIDVAVLRTTLMEIGEWVQADLYTGRIVQVRNSLVFSAPVYNFSGDFPYVWDELRVPVQYGSDHREARRILEQIVTAELQETANHARNDWQVLVRKYRIEDASVDPRVTVIATDNWMEFTVRYLVDYRRRRGTQDRLFTCILDAVDASEGRVRLASATVQIVGMPKLDVRMSGDSGGDRR